MNLSAKKHSMAEKISKNEGKGVKKDLLPDTKKLAIKHLKDSIAYNKRHAVDHEKLMRIDQKLLSKTSKGS